MRPVLDVNNNAENPVIAERSFSADPAEVARLAGAWMRGAQGEGVACCIKHFPGHGDTHVDSHLDLPVVDKPRRALDALELLPFRALRAEAPGVMTAHIVSSADRCEISCDVVARAALRPAARRVAIRGCRDHRFARDEGNLRAIRSRTRSSS
jgi:hypothetical protein